jgi:ribokinase
MRQRNVDLSKINILPDTPSGQATIILLPSGENSIVIVGGANMAWTELSPEQRVAVTESDALLMQREVPDSVNLDAARAAKQAGKLVVLDVGGRDTPFPDEILEFIDILSPNETELARLSGTHDLEAGIQWARDRGVNNILLKLGSQGSEFISPQFRVRQEVRTKEGVEVVDTTGAGDAFTGAFSVRLLELGGISEAAVTDALDFASRAAFLNITQIGAMEGMPSRSQIDNF